MIPEIVALPSSNESVAKTPLAWIVPESVSATVEALVISSELSRTIGAEIVSPALVLIWLSCAFGPLPSKISEPPVELIVYLFVPSRSPIFKVPTVWLEPSETVMSATMPVPPPLISKSKLAVAPAPSAIWLLCHLLGSSQTPPNAEVHVPSCCADAIFDVQNAAIAISNGIARENLSTQSAGSRAWGCAISVAGQVKGVCGGRARASKAGKGTKVKEKIWKLFK